MKKITLSLLFGLFTFFGFSQIGLVENFDAGLTLPPGWTGAGYSGSVFQTCSVVSLRANLSASNLSDDLISPNIVGQSNGTDLTVAFDYKIVDWSAAVDPTPPGWGEFLVQYSTNNGTAWTTMGTINDVNHVTSNTCANMSFVLPAASIPVGSSFKLRFLNNYFSGDYYFYIDNVTASQVVVDPPSCVNLISPTNGQTGVAITANLSWTAATGIPTGYTLSVGTSPGGTDIVDNLDVGLSTTYDLPDLDYSTIYYVTIIPYNGNGPAVGCSEYSFTTGADPNAPVDCGSGIPINTVFCYTNSDSTSFSFVSSDGAPLVVIFNSGSTENNFDELVITDSDGSNIYTGYGNAGNLAGLMFTSSGDTITVGVTSDSSVISCTSNPWNFDVSCLDTTALPNCNAVLTTPANGAVNVNENENLTWSAATVFVTGYTLYMGTTPGGTDVLNGLDVGNVLTYDPGTLAYDQTYYVTIIPYNDNGSATNCNEASFTVKADPNQIVDCDAGQVINTTFCYENNEISEWWFASSTGGPLSIYFNAGFLQESGFSGNTWDDLFIYDGTDNTGTLLYDSNDGIVGNNDLAGFSFVGNSGNLYLFFDADGSGNCVGNGYTPLDFDVSCVDTTALPNCNASLTIPLNGSVDVDEDDNLTWTAASVFVTGYTLYMGTTPGGTDVLDAVDVGNVLTYDLETLDYETTYYVTIIPYNDNGSATDCSEESFTTRADPNQIIDCANNQILNTVFCYENGIPMWTEIFSFQSSDGSPLNLTFNSGTIETCCDTLRLEEGDGTLIYQGTGNAGNFAGMSFNSTTDRIVMFYEADSSISCSSGSRVEWNFDVSCIDTSALPNCNASLTSPTNGELDVSENEDLVWTPATIFVTGYTLYMGTTPGGIDVLNGVDVGNVLAYDPGTLDYETTYYVTIIPYNTNGDATDCTEQFFTTRADPNQIIDCANNQILNTVFCYENGIPMWTEIFSFQSSDGSPLNMFFNSGTIETCCDTIRIEEGNGTVIYQGTGNAGDLAGLSLYSTTDRMVMFYEADSSVSCSSGSRIAWDFDVSCFDATAPPNCNADLTTPINGAIDVPINSTITWSPASIIVTGYTISIGTTPGGIDVANNVDVGNVLTYNPGALVNATTYYVTVTPYNDNGPATDCIEQSFQTICIPQVVTFNAVGDCDTDPNNPGFVLEVTISDLSGAASIIISDDQGSPTQTATAPGVITMGPYAANTVVTITTIKSDDDTCDVISSPITFICPPPPNSCSIVYAGEDVTIGCEESTELAANFHLFGQDTNNYIINGLETCPLPSTVGGTPTSLDIDDRWSQVISMGFEFCFFGQVYDQILIGSNGVLSFELENAGGFNDWAFTQTLPNSTNPTLSQANIFGVAHDIDPSVCGDINYLVIGSAPYRMFVVNYTNVCHFSCNQLMSSSQIILYESSNNIDVNVFDKPTCTTWNGGNAVIGVQNIAGDIAFTPPGRNTGVWSSTGESWRFAPYEDVPSFVFEWLDGTTSLGNTETITVSPSATTTYTASITYDLCTGGTATITDEVTVTVEGSEGDASFTMTATCDGATAEITGDEGGTFAFNPEPGDGALIDPVTGTITEGVSGMTYTVEYLITGDCGASSTQEVTVLDSEDASFTMTATCDGGTAEIIGNAGGTFALNPEPGDGATIDPVTGTITGGVSGMTYTVEYTTSDSECASSSMQEVTVLDSEDASFMMTATCDGGTAEITGTTGGTFAFNPEPGDGATIDPVTGTITGGMSGMTYTVEYTTSDSECASSSMQNVTVLPAEDASFTMTATCDGGTAEVSGTTGGTFAFNPEPGDGAMIDPVTGTITGGMSGMTYTVEYTTSDSECASSSIQDVTVLPAEDASFTMNATCDGGTAEITGTSGGTFAFNPEPGDGAMIDPITGTITGGMSGMTYTVEYTTSDSECASSSMQDVTVLDSEDASFTLTTTCDGAIAEITGNTGGTFSFNPEPGDGATIDPVTGTITGGTLGSSYTVEYSTSGPCPASSLQTITVEDLENPVAMCNNITVMLGSNGMYLLTEGDIESIGMESTDNCGIESMSVSTNSFTCDNIGENTVTLTITDFGGNTSTCEATITVDGIIPTVEITETPLSVFCQGVTLTAESEGNVTYLWTTGEITESIVVTENGTYGLTVTSETNCSTYIEYTVTSIEEGTPLSEYAIFAFNEIYLHGNNLVQTGGVGVGSSNGEIKLHQNSHISNFGQATTFTLNQGSTIGEQINEAANPIMLDFIYNTLSNSSSPSVTISNGDTQTLDGDVYDQVWVREGATVIFSQPNVYVNRIKTSDGANIEFAECTNVYVNNMFILAKNGTINSNGNAVTFYVNNDVHIEKGSNVRAIIYSNGNQILAKGSNSNSNNPEPTYMTGLFIANKVHGLNNVIWNADVICDPCQVSEPDGNNRSINFDVTSWPNPSDTVFNLRLVTDDYINNAIIEVFDMNNKLVHKDQFRPDQAYNFGSRLNGGIYIVKISQTRNSKIIKLVKF